MKRTTIFIVTGGLLAAVFAGVALLYAGSSDQRSAQIAAHNKESLIRFHSPSIGKADAPTSSSSSTPPAGPAPRFIRS
jgi:hypothetical protein